MATSVNMHLFSRGYPSITLALVLLIACGCENEPPTGSGATASTGSGTSSSSGMGNCGGDEICVDAAPMGWKGPVQVYEGGALPPPCPPTTTLAFQGGSGLNAPPAVCSTCTCGAPTGVTCELPTSTLHAMSTCQPEPCVVFVVGSTCTLVKTAAQCNLPGVFVNMSVSESLATGGSCMPSPEMPTVPPAAWTTNALACTPIAAPMQCGVDKECAQAPDASFGLCIYHDGDVACPPGAYASKSLIDTNVVDTRTCTDCACSAPGACSGGKLRVSSDSSCSSGTDSNVPTACKFSGFQASLDYYAQLTTLPTPTGCTPLGGQPTGSANSTNPITVCCQ